MAHKATKEVQADAAAKAGKAAAKAGKAAAMAVTELGAGEAVAKGVSKAIDKRKQRLKAQYERVLAYENKNKKSVKDKEK